jgi:aminoglycoside 2'-N-acetyltransferase I
LIDRNPSGLRWVVHRVADLTASEQAALESLSLAVFPPEIARTLPGRAFEWAEPEWSIIGWDADSRAVCHAGILCREVRWNERPVKVGGIGDVRTHPAARRRGLASTAMKRAVDFLRGQPDVDFGLLVCEADLVPFYEHLGWQRFAGDLFVTQRKIRVPFTFNLPMTIPIRLEESLGGIIDLLGPPW